jgi:putative membrane protein
VKKFFQGWLINTLAVLVAVYVLKGRIHYDKPLDLCVASLLLGVLNAVVRPVLFLLTLRLLIFTLGFFALVINALLLLMVSALMQPHFYVDGFWGAFWGALVISLVSLILNVLAGTRNTVVRVERQRPPPKSGPDDHGPIIDI